MQGEEIVFYLESVQFSFLFILRYHCFKGNIARRKSVLFRSKIPCYLGYISVAEESFEVKAC